MMFPNVGGRKLLGLACIIVLAFSVTGTSHIGVQFITLAAAVSFWVKE